MSRLTENYVKRKSIEVLSDWYSEKYNLHQIYSGEEVRTVKNGRADGFLAFHAQLQQFHIVSIEAKSHRTLFNLKPFIDGDRFALHIFYAAIAIGAVAAIYFWELPWYWLLVLFLCAAGLAFGAIAVLSDKSEPNIYKVVDVVKQVERYPANEKWIAVSSDSLNLLKERKAYIKGCSYENLLRICRKKGIGLLVVYKGGHTVQLIPRFRKGKFLHCYQKEKEIREYFNLQPKMGIGIS